MRPSLSDHFMGGGVLVCWAGYSKALLPAKHLPARAKKTTLICDEGF